MSAATLLNSLLSAGYTVTTVNGNIRVAPKERLTDDMRAAIRTHKAELLALLTIPPAGPPSPLPAGALSLWLWDRLHPMPGVTPFPPPAALTRTQVAEAIATATAAYAAEVQNQSDHPPALAPREPWRPNAPCHRCQHFDWYTDDAGKWRCGWCTPAAIAAPDEESHP